jgi:3-oxoacid CoA-transferase subunit A
MINKVVKNAEEATKDIKSGDTIMLGGFGLCGIPENSIAALVAVGVSDLTCISNNAGVDDFGIGLLLQKHQVRKMISSYVGENKEFERQLLAGELEVELIPQGTLAERIRAGGAGIPAFYTPAGVGTEVAEGKEIKEFEGKKYVQEAWLKADFSIIKAWKGDYAGNLVFRGTTQNFSPMMATAGKICIAEVEELVEVGQLNPNEIHVPGIYVQRIFEGKNYEKRIEQRTKFSLPAANGGESGVPAVPEKVLKNDSFWAKADPVTYRFLKEYSLKMRNIPTQTEEIIWNELVGKKLEGFKFRRQHIIGNYIPDFVCLKQRLIIEIDGLIHQLPENLESDKVRTEWFANEGYRVVRFTNEEVLTDLNEVLNKIKINLNKKLVLITNPEGGSNLAPPSGVGGRIAARIALEIKNNSYVNLGIGLYS